MSTTSISLSLISPFLFVCILFIPGCSNEVAAQYRLVDRIKDAQIDSPLETLPATDPSDVQGASAPKTDREKLRQVVEKYTNRDLAFGDNTYPFALKVTLASELRSVLFAPTPSTYQFTLRIPKKARLDFGYGIMSESWEDGYTGAHFEIDLIDASGNSHALFSESINPNRIQSERTWFDRRIGLSSYADQEITLKMKTGRVMPTEAEPSASLGNRFEYAVWSNPTLFATTRKDDKLNVILISYDTLRADHLGCYGYGRETSPNIDQFAKNAVLFKNAFSASSWTLPSHASIFTSLLPSRHQATVDTSDASQGKFRTTPLADTYLTLTEVLRDTGYATAAFTGGGYVASSLGFHQGFDAYRDAHGIEDIFDKAITWLERHRSRNFFLFLHTYEIHTPYHRRTFTTGLDKGRFSESFKYESRNCKNTSEHNAFLNLLSTATAREKEYMIALYDGGIYYADRFMGALLKQLERLNLRKNTLIVFLSDHGEELWDRYPQMSGQHGHSPYDELLHVPLVISIPQESSGQMIDPPVSLIDVFPTVLDLLDVSYDSRRIHGSSLVPLIMNTSPRTDDHIAYSEDLWWGPNRHSIRTDTFKFIYTPDLTGMGDYYTGVDFFSIDTLVLGEMHQQELYNLINDPKEQTNIAAQNKQFAAKFRKQVRGTFGVVTTRWLEKPLDVIPHGAAFGTNTMLIQLEGVIKPIEAVDVLSRAGEKWDTKDGRLKMIPNGAGNVYLTFDDPTHTKQDIYLLHIHYGDKTTTRLTVERSIGAKGE